MNNEELKQKALDTATELFVRDGCKRVTMDNIASEMHISKRTLYETFANKEELLGACLLQIRDNLQQESESLKSQAEEPMLLALYMMRNAMRFNSKYINLIRDAERYYPEIHKQYFVHHSREYYQNMMNSLKQAQADGLVRENVDLETVVTAMHTFVSQCKDLKEDDLDRWHRMFGEIGYIITRGIMTTDAIIRYDQQEAHFHKIMSQKQ